MKNSKKELHKMCNYLQNNFNSNENVTSFANDLLKSVFKKTVVDESNKYRDEFKKLKINSLPLNTSFGLAYTYLTVQDFIEKIEKPLSKTAFDENFLNRNQIKSEVKGIIEELPALGDKALEMASRDPSFLDRLSGAFDDLGTAYADGENVFGSGNCENGCLITIKDDQGNIIDRRCGTKDECADGWIIVVIVVAVVVLKWIFDLF